MRNTVDITTGGIERDVEKIILASHAVRQRLAQRSQRPLSHSERESFESTPSAVGDISRVTRKKLVAAVARQYDRHIIAGELRNHIGRQGARIRKGLIKMPDEIVDHIDKI